MFKLLEYLIFKSQISHFDKNDVAKTLSPFYFVKIMCFYYLYVFFNKSVFHIEA